MSDSLLEVVLNGAAKDACLTIFHDFSLDEVSRLPISIQEAWKAGRDFERFNADIAIRGN